MTKFSIPYNLTNNRNFDDNLKIPSPLDDEDEEDYGVDERSAAWNLITRLICLPEDRIGFGKSSRHAFKMVLKHDFFNALDIDKLMDTEVPFVPQVAK